MQSNKLENVEDYAFAFCGIDSIFIPKTLVSLGDYVFFGSTALRSLSVAEDNPEYCIIDSALYNLDGTTLYYYPSGLAGEYSVNASTVEIDKAAFAYSRSGEVVLNGGIQTIGESAFAYSRINGISFPASVSTLGASVGENGTSLTQIVFDPNGELAIIPVDAFYGDSLLKTVTIQKSVKKIDLGAFMCSGLSELLFAI